MEQVMSIAYTASIYILPVLLAITLHEAAHGWMANRLGDDTARRMGRVTFNPLKHIDRFGTILMPALLLLVSGGAFAFGYAKPVPVAFHRLRRPRRDMVYVALAGPVANLILAFLAALLIHLAKHSPIGAMWLIANLFNALWINVVLAVFNMLPLPPLDGGRVAVGVLPDMIAMPLARLERYGLPILVGILFVLPMIGEQFGAEWGVYRWWIGPIGEQVLAIIAFIAGLG